MKLRCPKCGADLKLDEATQAAELQALDRAAAAFGADWDLVAEYLDLFRRRADGPLAVKVRLRLAREVWKIYSSGKFEFERQDYVVGRPELLEALRITCSQAKQGLTNHNYWKRVLQSAAHETSVRRERELRDKEAGLRGGREEDRGPGTGDRGQDAGEVEDDRRDDPEWLEEFMRLSGELRKMGLTQEQRAAARAALEEFTHRKPGIANHKPGIRNGE